MHLSSDIFGYALVDAFIAVDGAFEVQRPAVELFAYNGHPVRACYHPPVFHELHLGIRDAMHHALQLSTLMQVEHVVSHRLQEGWWVWESRCVMSNETLGSAIVEVNYSFM